MQVGRLHGIEKFEGQIKNFILNTFINFKPSSCLRHCDYVLYVARLIFGVVK